MEGTATLHMGNPMTAMEFPLQGTCSVDGKTLKMSFPGTGTAIPLPSKPKAGQDDQTFKLQGGVEFVVTYNSRLRAFQGEGRKEDTGKKVVSFVFYETDCMLADLTK